MALVYSTEGYFCEGEVVKNWKFSMEYGRIVLSELELSLVKKSNEANRYYVDGQMYNSWDKIPQSYKTEIIMSTQDPADAGIKLNFK